jgi:hypothetical protein
MGNKYKTVWVGALHLLGESDKAYKVCGAEAFTSDPKKMIAAVQDEHWIPKSICIEAEVKRNKEFPLMKELVVRLPDWFVKQNLWFEDKLEETEQEVEDSYDRFRR